jgi:hypothetical protein
MVEDAFGKSLDEGQPVGGCEIDPRLPLLGAALAERFRRNLNCMSFLPDPLCGLPLGGALTAVMSGIVTQSGDDDG